jgi:hypothetical protein
LHLSISARGFEHLERGDRVRGIDRRRTALAQRSLELDVESGPVPRLASNRLAVLASHNAAPARLGLDSPCIPAVRAKSGRQGLLLPVDVRDHVPGAGAENAKPRARSGGERRYRKVAVGP